MEIADRAIDALINGGINSVKWTITLLLYFSNYLFKYRIKRKKNG
jgi:hypothetical protein